MGRTPPKAPHEETSPQPMPSLFLVLAQLRVQVWRYCSELSLKVVGGDAHRDPTARQLFDEKEARDCFRGNTPRLASQVYLPDLSHLSHRPPHRGLRPFGSCHTFWRVTGDGFAKRPVLLGL